MLILSYFSMKKAALTLPKTEAAPHSWSWLALKNGVGLKRILIFCQRYLAIHRSRNFLQVQERVIMKFESRKLSGLY